MAAEPSATKALQTYIQKVGLYKPITLIDAVVNDKEDRDTKQGVAARVYADMFMVAFRATIRTIIRDGERDAEAKVLANMPKKLLLAQRFVELQKQLTEMNERALAFSKDEKDGLDDLTLQVIILEGWIAEIHECIAAAHLEHDLIPVAAAPASDLLVQSSELEKTANTESDLTLLAKCFDSLHRDANEYVRCDISIPIKKFLEIKGALITEPVCTKTNVGKKQYLQHREYTLRMFNITAVGTGSDDGTAIKNAWIQFLSKLLAHLAAD